MKKYLQFSKRLLLGVLPKFVMAADLIRYWEMMVDLYGRGGVADICLDLQDRFGTDVVFLLFLRLLDHQAILLGELKRRDARAVVTAWHAHVVVQLRTLRQWLKPLAGTAAAGSYRNRIKDAELEAEHMELDMLVHWLSLQKLTPVSPDSTNNARDFLLQAGVDRLTVARFLTLTA